MKQFVKLIKHLLKVCVAIIGIVMIFSLPVNPYALMSASADTLIATIFIVVFVVIPYSVYVWFNIIEWLNGNNWINGNVDEFKPKESDTDDEEE